MEGERQAHITKTNDGDVVHSDSGIALQFAVGVKRGAAHGFERVRFANGGGLAVVMQHSPGGGLEGQGIAQRDEAGGIENAQLFRHAAAVVVGEHLATDGECFQRGAAKGLGLRGDGADAGD